MRSFVSKAGDRAASTSAVICLTTTTVLASGSAVVGFFFLLLSPTAGGLGLDATFGFVTRRFGVEHTEEDADAVVEPVPVLRSLEADPVTVELRTEEVDATDEIELLRFGVCTEPDDPTDDMDDLRLGGLVADGLTEVGVAVDVFLGFDGSAADGLELVGRLSEEDEPVVPRLGVEATEDGAETFFFTTFLVADEAALVPAVDVTAFFTVRVAPAGALGGA